MCYVFFVFSMTVNDCYRRVLVTRQVIACLNLYVLVCGCCWMDRGFGMGFHSLCVVLSGLLMCLCLLILLAIICILVNVIILLGFLNILWSWGIILSILHFSITFFNAATISVILFAISNLFYDLLFSKILIIYPIITLLFLSHLYICSTVVNY